MCQMHGRRGPEPNINVEYNTETYNGRNFKCYVFVIVFYQELAYISRL
jgi:hypothetical protein